MFRYLVVDRETKKIRGIVLLDEETFWKRADKCDFYMSDRGEIGQEHDPLSSAHPYEDLPPIF